MGLGRQEGDSEGSPFFLLLSMRKAWHGEGTVSRGWKEGKNEVGGLAPTALSWRYLKMQREPCVIVHATQTQAHTHTPSADQNIRQTGTHVTHPHVGGGSTLHTSHAHTSTQTCAKHAHTCTRLPHQGKMGNVGKVLEDRWQQRRGRNSECRVDICVKREVREREKGRQCHDLGSGQPQDPLWTKAPCQAKAQPCR